MFEEDTSAKSSDWKEKDQSPERKNASEPVSSHSKILFSPRSMKPIKTDMEVSEREKPQKIILAREKNIRAFYGGESELKSFEEDLYRRWEEDPDSTLGERVQDILDHVGPEVREEIMMHDDRLRQDPYELLKLLYRLYCKKSLSERMSEFYSCRQGMHENVMSYSRRLHRIAEGVRYRQNLDSLAPLEETVERDVFITGLTDITLKKRLKESVYKEEADSFLDIRNEAVRWEETDDHHVMAAPARAQVSSPLSTSLDNAGASPMSLDAMIAKITEGVTKEVRGLKDEMKEENKKLAKRIENLEMKINPQPYNNRGRANDRSFRGRGRGKRLQTRQAGPNDQCWGCKEYGHFQYQCGQGNDQPQQLWQ